MVMMYSPFAAVFVVVAGLVPRDHHALVVPLHCKSHDSLFCVTLLSPAAFRFLLMKGTTLVLLKILVSKRDCPQSLLGIRLYDEI